MAPVAQAQGQGPPSPAVIELLLDTPALQAPPGADTTMTTDGPDQVWYLVVAITCVAIPGLFLMVRVYTKLAIVRSLEIADCKSTSPFMLAQSVYTKMQTSSSSHFLLSLSKLGWDTIWLNGVPVCINGK